MLALAELQRVMAADVLEGGGACAALFADGPIDVLAALAVHRDTVVGGLVNALRLGFPTVDRLVGEAFFDQAAAAYARAEPPRAADLHSYGGGFPDFLRTYDPAGEAPYLADVARFDLAVERTAAAPQGGAWRTAALDEGVALTLAASLSLLRIDYPADLIRRLLDSGDEDALADLDMRPTARTLALWRGPGGPSAVPISAPAAAFLFALLGGLDAGAATTAALDHAEADQALACIRDEVFAAPFAQVLAGDAEGDAR